MFRSLPARVAALAAIAIHLCASAALAASPPAVTPYSSPTPMRVFIVHDIGSPCASACTDWIAAEGDIIESTPAEFKRVFKALGERKLPILIHSGGGSVNAAMIIGRLIRARKLDVFVAKPLLSPCQPGSKFCGAKGQHLDGSPGMADGQQAYCASACALILAAGTRRYVPFLGNVGVHQIWQFRTLTRVKRLYRITRRMVRGVPVEVSRKLISEKTLSSKLLQGEAKDKDYKPNMAFLTEMGIDGSILPLMLSTPHTDIRWLTKAELDATHMVTLPPMGANVTP